MISEKIDVYKRKLLGVFIAYNKVFDYKSPFTKEVLKDLAKFCRAHETTYHPDPRIHAVLEGRREVWLRIQEHLNLTIDQIYELHKVQEYYPDKRGDKRELEGRS